MRRRFVAYALILIFTAIPYVKIGGRPLVLLDLPARRFTIFGVTFLPTDTVLLALFMVSVFVAIFLLTALFGRVWCGWACPQTVYMEFVYRPIERLFEGSPGRRKKGFLAESGLGKVLKFAAFGLVSLYLAHTFLAYFVGVERLAQWVTRSPLEHPAGFLIVMAVTGLMLFDFGYFREQTCLVACPYGRFQSALLDRSSLIVTYDPKRGEPRGKRSVSLPVVNGHERTQGDCVDCGLCVATCPTGIDIRNGLQMECIHCAQCIDACDAVMTMLGRPRGLIRYGSQDGIAGKPRRFLRPRVVIYPMVLAIVLTALGIGLAVRGPADVVVLRGLGRPYTELPAAEGGIAEVENPVRVKIVNRTDALATFRVVIAGIEGARVTAEENPVRVPPRGSKTAPMMLVVPASAFTHGTVRVRLRFEGEGGVVVERPYTLVGPASRPVSSGSTQSEGGKR
ncbi:MAG: cytochrome c oxidase accessory protein CcoG [Phycisphaerae bacterium]|nr:cytochrome c oxidase accessory protein CcoG [Phycisphaerae bacterium]